MSKLIIQIISDTRFDASNELLHDLLATKLPKARIKQSHVENVSELSFKQSNSVLFITKDQILEKSLIRINNSEVLVWKTLQELSVKLDMFIQLRRYVSKFPLSLSEWRLKEVLYNCDDFIIYRAVNSLGQQAAIKRFKFLPSCLTDKTIQKHLLKIDEQCGLNSKGLVQYYGGGISEADNAFYLVTEYLKYGTLRQALDDCGNHLPLHHAIEWFQEIVVGLNSVHKAGLIHRDLKIDNIFLRDDGSLALASYGVCKRIFLDSGFVIEEELYCSPHYVSPEQITGDACTQLSDIYSLGVIFYEILTGKKPYSARKPHELMMHHVMAPVPELPNEFSQYQVLLDKMMAKDPEDRFTSVLDLLAESPLAV